MSNLLYCDGSYLEFNDYKDFMEVLSMIRSRDIPKNKGPQEQEDNGNLGGSRGFGGGGTIQFGGAGAKDPLDKSSSK